MDKKIQTSLYLPPQLAKDIKYFCIDNRMKMNDFLIQAAKEKLEKK
jgi:hypothetical protein